MKKISTLVASLASIGIVNAADYSSCPMMNGGYFSAGMMTYGLLYVLIIAIIFSVVFWLTYKLINDNKKRK
ncbi:MAG: hypothetical protein KKD48_04685 [Nanoarchaeota archaeon]|nr:hypothetical protein [Nanoarchaeota archaeon]